MLKYVIRYKRISVMNRIFRKSFMRKKYKLFFGVQGILIFFGAVLSLYPIVIIEEVTNLAISGVKENTNKILWFGGAYLAIQIVRASVIAISNYYSGVNQADITYRLQMDIYDYIKNAKLQAVKTKDVTYISTTLVEDTEYVGENIIKSYCEFTTNFFLFILGVYFVSKINLYLAFLVFPLALISAYTTKRLAEKSYQNLMEQRMETVGLWKTFEEGMKGFLPLRIHGYIMVYREKILLQGNQLKNSMIKQNFLESVTFFMTSSLFMVTIGLIMIVSAIFVIKGDITIGAMTAILMYNNMLSDPLIELQEIVKKLQKLKVSLDRIQTLLELPADGNEREHGAVDRVCLKNVSYCVDEKNILDDVNICVKRQEAILITGETGAGKSTLVNLIAGVYECTNGKIVYSNNNVKVDVIPKVSYMLQDEYLFDDTIYNNIRIGNAKAEESQIKKVISLCGLAEVVKKHPDKIGENGIKLSGGERKRILLARTIIDEADIYIFDEMSASLDQETFVTVWNNVNQYLDEKIRIYIEHNLAMVKCVNRVFHVENQKVVCS